jgi:hypothetical protein
MIFPNHDISSLSIKLKFLQKYFHKSQEQKYLLKQPRRPENKIEPFTFTATYKSDNSQAVSATVLSGEIVSD